MSTAGEGDDGACHSGGSQHTPVDAPWRGAAREDVKTRLYRYVRSTREGVPLSKIVGDVFGVDADAGGAEYQLARRFFDRHPEFFKTDRRGDLLWVEPRIGIFTRLNLRQQYAKRKTTGRDGGGTTATEATGDLEGSDDGTAGGRGDDREDDGPTYAKGRTRSFLSHYLRFDADSVKRSLLEQLVEDVEGTADKWQVFERVRGEGDDYLCLPYRTRHNDGRRARGVREGFEDALRQAAGRHTEAVVLTVTTDPKEHDSLTDAVDALTTNKGRLMSWLSTEYQIGYRPENLSVLQFTESGLPHYHIVLFGVSWAVSQEQLAEKWRSYGQGYVVDARTARNPHDGDTWLLHDDEQGRVSLSWYLGKAIRELVDVAESTPADLRDRLEDGDISAWRQALYWATERRYYTCSPSLKRSTPDDDLPHVPVWEFVGVAEYADLPAHVRQGATFGDRPPPATGSASSSTSATAAEAAGD
jgi:hypothetical protein